MKQSFRALIYDERKEYKEVIQMLETYLQTQPDNTHAYNNLGVAYWETGKTKKAIQAFAQAILVNPKNPIPYLNQGDICKKRGALDQAISYYTAAIQQQGETSYYLCRAYAFMEQQSLELALKDFEMAERLGPENQRTQMMMEQIKKQLNQSDR